MKIDAVVTWVDGKCSTHKQKIAPFLPVGKRRSDDTNGETRYNSEGEIFYCVASILRFAPFIQKIFIVSDEQNPKLDEFLQKNFPENTIPIEIIDHKVIFRGYEEYLPVFNSRAVETCLHRIPNLSENYIYFNDDFFLIRPTKITDWFDDDKIVAYGNWRNMLLDRLLWLIKPLKNGRKPVGFKDGMICAARKLGYKWRYFHLDHLPHPLKKSVVEQFYSENPKLFLSNISHKFRSGKQFNTAEINYLLNIEAENEHNYFVFMLDNEDEQDGVMIGFGLTYHPDFSVYLHLPPQLLNELVEKYVLPVSPNNTYNLLDESLKISLN
jgi:hypothetical protein